MNNCITKAQEGINCVLGRICTAMTGQDVSDKKGMEILQFIVIAAIVAVICVIALPKISDTLLKSNDNTIDAISNLSDTIGQ